MMERVLDFNRTDKPILSVLGSSLKFYITKPLVCEQRSSWRSQKNVDCLHAHK